MRLQVKVILHFHLSFNVFFFRFSDYTTISWPVTFESIQIQGNFTKVHTRQQYPCSLLGNIRPVLPSATEWTTIDYEDVLERSYILKNQQNRLLTFAIYGRDFARDNDPFADNSAKLLINQSFLVGVIIFFLQFI